LQCPILMQNFIVGRFEAQRMHNETKNIGIIPLKNTTLTNLSHEAFQKKFLKGIFENAQDVFFMVNYNHKNEQVDFVMSQSVMKTFGYNQEELQDLNFEDLYKNPQDRLTFLELIKAKKRVKNYPLKLKKKDETVVFVEVDYEYLAEYNSEKIAF